MSAYSISYFKTHILRLLGNFDNQKEEIIITKRGKPLARVIPYSEIVTMINTPGCLSDMVISEGDLITPFGEDEWELKL